MDTVTLRWMIVGEVAVAVLFGVLMLRPDVWLYWRSLAAAGLAAFIVVPLATGLYLVHVDRKLRSRQSAHRVERA